MSTETGGKKELTLIFITLLIDIIGIGIIIPILPDLLRQLSNSTLSEASAIAAWMVPAFALPQFLFAPIMGGLSDKYGRRPILIISLLGLGLDYIFHAVAPSIAWLFVGRVIAGICGASFTTASSYIADISTPEKRAQNFGLIGVAFGVGFILGPVIGGLAGDGDVRMPFYIAAGLSLVNAVVCFFMLPESLKKENRREFDIKRANPLGMLFQIKNYPKVMQLMLPLFLLYLASHAVQSNWPYYTKYKFGWDNKTVGLSLGFVGIMIAIVQGGLIRVIIPKLGNERSILYGFGLYFVGMLLFALADQGWMMFAITAIYCVSGISGPAMQGEMSQSVPANAQGELSGATTSLMSLSAVIGPLIMNNLFAKFTGKNAIMELPGAPMLLGALLVAISYFMVWKLYGKKARTARAQKAD